MKDLKPCPFCGHVGLEFGDGSTFRWLAYSCGGCGIGSEVRITTFGVGTPEEWRADAEREAVTVWNTRAQAPAAQWVEVPHDLAKSDAEFWLRHRTAIIAAVRDAGLTIVTTAHGVHLMRLGKIEAQSAQAPAAEPLEAVVSAYRVGDGIGAIKVERVMQIAGADLWAVRRYAEVLSKQGAWEWEPLPSSRDDDFLARCRFATSDEAIAAALAAAKEQP